MSGLKARKLSSKKEISWQDAINLGYEWCQGFNDDQAWEIDTVDEHLDYWLGYEGADLGREEAKKIIMENEFRVFRHELRYDHQYQGYLYQEIFERLLDRIWDEGAEPTEAELEELLSPFKQEINALGDRIDKEIEERQFYGSFVNSEYVFKLTEDETEEILKLVDWD